MNPDINPLKRRLETYTDLLLTSEILGWDQATMMPAKGSDQRGRQLATLTNTAHCLLISDDTKRLIHELLPWAERQKDDNTDAALIKEAKRIYDLKAKIPSNLASAMAQHFAQMYAAWTTARPNNDFSSLKPMLETSVDFSLRLAECFPDSNHPMDALIQFSDRGFVVDDLKRMFQKLRSHLVPLVESVKSKRQIDSDCLIGDFPEATQLRFGIFIARQLGYDFQRGRLDLSPHPFMTRLSGGDIRITTRSRRDDLTDCIFSVIHEVGHALYEMGIAESIDGNILGQGVSSGVHESQSRLWENCVGRGKPFWDFFYPHLQNEFPQFKSIEQSEFLRAINKVEPSLIRVDADELTYNLHVMIRFDIERDILEGRLKIKDLPDAWNSRYKSDLGVTVPSFKDGCLQDVHWFSSAFGGSFQGYSIGNILSAQIYAAAKKSLPNMEDKFSKGDFQPLLQWLQNKVHRWGATRNPTDLIHHATGAELSIECYMDYLTKKYSELYSV